MKHALILSSALVFALTGCGSSSDDDVSPPIVKAITPNGGSIDATRTPSITVTFSEDMLADSISDTSFTLALEDTPITGVVSYDDANKQASFVPNEELTILTSYTASLTTDVTDLAGNSINYPLTWSFFRDGILDVTAQSAQTESGVSLENPTITYLDNGTALAVWERVGIPKEIWTNQYTSDDGWGTAVKLQTNMTAGTNPTIASSGNQAIAMWLENGTDVWVAVYDAVNETWDTPESLVTGADAVSSPSVAIDSNGNSTAIWSQTISGTDDILARYLSDGTWATAVTIDNLAGDAASTALDMDESGNAIAVWSQNDGSFESVYSNRFTAGTWGTAAPIETDDTGNTSNHAIKLDSAGNAIAIWSNYIAAESRSETWVNQYQVESNTWSTAVTFESMNESEEATFSEELPVMDMNENGQTIVIWANRNTDNNATTYISRFYDHEAGWGDEETFEYTADNHFASDVAMDINGNALFVWSFDDGVSTIWSNRYIETTDVGWAGDGEVLVSLGDNLGDSAPQVAMKQDEKGEGILIFRANSTSEDHIGFREFK